MKQERSEAVACGHGELETAAIISDAMMNWRGKQLS